MRNDGGIRRPSLLDGAIRAGGDPLEEEQERRYQQQLQEDIQRRGRRRVSGSSAEHSAAGTDRSTNDDHSHVSSRSPGYSSSAHGSAVTRVASNITTTPDYEDDSAAQQRRYEQRRTQQSSRSAHNSSSTLVVSNRQSDAAQQPLFFRHVDDNCNAPDYEVNLFFQLCEVTLQPVSATSKEATRWANIRRWFLDHRSRAERYAACVQQGVFSTTPLHFICQNPSCPLDILNAMISYGAETVSWEDANGWLPLHYACAKNASFEVLTALLEAYPDAEVAQDKRLRTPLHFVFYKSSGNDSENSHRNSNGNGSDNGNKNDSNHLEEKDKDIARVVNLLRRSTIVGDEKGRLPIHLAAAYGTSVAGLEALVQSCPRSLYLKENSGKSPLHLIMANAHNSTSPQVLECLLNHVRDHDSINDVDDAGNLPLHLMSMRVEGMSGDTVHEKNLQQNIKACLKLYLDAKPTLSADFLNALQSLPGWLRDVAVTHPHVQKILNHRIADMFPTFILLLDGYLYMLIIICFSHAAKSHIQFRFGSDDLPYNISSTIGACSFGATYFLLRETIKVASMISLNTLRSWFVRIESWLNIIVISLIYYYSGAMHRRRRELDRLTALGVPDFGSQDDLNFRSGVAFTLGALWLSVVNFVKSTMLEFSVFHETVLCVTKNLFIFMISLAVILIAFAQMFLIVFRKTPVCSDKCLSNDESGFPHCSFNKSFLKVYTMMLGEIGEVNRYQQSLTAQILYVAFVFVVVILLSNVLIAIVTDSHSVVKNERAEIVFWSNRLDFVAEMDAIGAMRNRLVTRVFRGGYSAQDQDPSTSNLDSEMSRSRHSWTEDFREYWTHLIDFLKEVHSDDTSLLEYYLFLFLRLLVVILVIPIWIGLGFLSAGILWPPQVREWLFVMRKGDPNDSATARANSEIQTIKASISRTKSDFLKKVECANDECVTVEVAIQNTKNNLENNLADVKRLSIEMLLLSKEQYKRKHRLRVGDSTRRSRKGSQGKRSDSSGKSMDSKKTRSNDRRLVSTRGDRSD